MNVKDFSALGEPNDATKARRNNENSIENTKKNTENKSKNQEEPKYIRRTKRDEERTGRMRNKIPKTTGNNRQGN